jgi:hypothetical protein
VKYRKWTRTLLTLDAVRNSGSAMAWLAGMHRHYWPEAWKLCADPYVLLHLVGALSPRKTYVEALTAGLAQEMPTLFGYGTPRQGALRGIGEAYGMVGHGNRQDHWRYQIEPLVVGVIATRQQPSAALFEAFQAELLSGTGSAMNIPWLLEKLSTFFDPQKTCKAIRDKTARPALPGHVSMA